MGSARRIALVMVGLLLACFTVMSVAAARPACAASGRGATSARRAAALQNNERILFALINKARTRRGLGALRAQHNLARAARLHSRQMIVHDFFSHSSPNGQNYGARIARCGYGRSGYKVWRVGEVLAWGKGVYGVPQLVLRRWMGSSVHRAVILDRRWREVGVGLVKGRFCGMSGVYLYTVDFGRRGG
jgi:uncharacterized protein YkwD